MIYGVQCMPGSPPILAGGEIFVADFENNTYTLNGVSKTLADVVSDPSFVGGGKLEVLTGQEPPEIIGDFATELLSLSGWSLVVDVEVHSGQRIGRCIVGWVDEPAVYDNFMEWTSIVTLKGEALDGNGNYLSTSQSLPSTGRTRLGLTFGPGGVMTVTKQNGSPTTGTGDSPVPVWARVFIGTSFADDALPSDSAPFTMYSMTLYSQLSPTDLQTAVDTGSAP